MCEWDSVFELPAVEAVAQTEIGARLREIVRRARDEMFAAGATGVCIAFQFPNGEGGSSVATCIRGMEPKALAYTLCLAEWATRFGIAKSTVKKPTNILRGK